MVEPAITCKFTGVLDFSRLLGELPLNGFTFSKVLNSPGPWAGSLNVEDAGIQKAQWIEITAVNRTAMWVDIGGALLYGGITQGRRYQMSTGKVDLSGNDFCCYFSQRNQGGDYANYADPEGRAWASTGAPVLRIAYYVLAQALEKAYSIPIRVVTEGSEPESQYWITFAAPKAQHQSLSSILSQLQEMGYLTGIDYALDVAYVAGVPTATVTLSYPRRGTASEAAPLVIDLSAATDLEYDEDGTTQADFLVEQAGATVVRSSAGIWEPARRAGYPLLETTVSHTAMAPSGNPAAALEAYVSADLATLAYPLTAPVLTLPLFGTPSIFDIEVGDNIVLRVPVAAGAMPDNNPRFPEGLEFTLRIVRIDVTVPDEGLAVMALTLNQPPSLIPVEPPETEGGEGGTGGGSEKKTKKEEEEEAREKLKEEEEVQKQKEEAEAEAKVAEEEAQKQKEEAEAEVAKAKKEEEEAKTTAEKEYAEQRKKEAEEALAQANANLEAAAKVKKEAKEAKKLKEALKKREKAEAIKRKAQEDRERHQRENEEKNSSHEQKRGQEAFEKPGFTKLTVNQGGTEFKEGEKVDLKIDKLTIVILVVSVSTAAGQYFSIQTTAGPNAGGGSPVVPMKNVITLPLAFGETFEIVNLTEGGGWVASGSYAVTAWTLG